VVSGAQLSSAGKPAVGVKRYEHPPVDPGCQWKG